jgi:hypothetical protein
MPVYLLESRVFGNFVTGASAGRPILFEKPERILTHRHAFGVIVPFPVGAHTQFVFYLPEKIVWKPLRSVLLDMPSCAVLVNDSDEIISLIADFRLQAASFRVAG